MLLMLLRKMNKNRWMVLCLLLGLILTLAIISSVPIYSRGILERVLSKDLDDFQAKTHLYPGMVTYSTDANTAFDKNKPDSRLKEFNKLNSVVEDYSKRMPLSIFTSQCIISVTDLAAIADKTQGGDNIGRPPVNLITISDFKNHIKIVSGRMFSQNKNSDDEYEVVVSAQGMQNLNLILNRSYDVYYTSPKKSVSQRRVKVVGVYTYKDVNDPFWADGEWAHSSSMIMDFDLFKNVFLKTDESVISSISWVYSYDYKKISTKNIDPILSSTYQQETELKKNYDIGFLLPAYDILNQYSGKETELITVLWVLQTPILLMLLIYIFMVANLIAQQDKSEISVLQSRGAGMKDILSIYILESLVLSIIALLLGPPLGLYFCKILGSSNGFLEFVQRTPLSVKLSPMEYVYSLIAIVVFIITMLIPVIKASKTTIVVQKQSKFKSGVSIWKKYYLDVVLLLAAGAGIYSFYSRQKFVSSSSISSSSVPVSPILYMISTFFVLSLGLVFLRIYPYIIRLIFTIGKKRWSPAAYSSLINIGRSDGQNQFLMIFLIMTISIGIFNVKAARTVNGNLENRIHYLVGADIVLTPKLVTNDPDEPLDENGLYTKIAKLDGISLATKVLHKENVEAKIGTQEFKGVNLYGIVPNEFGKVAWFRPELLPYHWYEYLNIMSKEPNVILVSKNLQERYGLEVGERIYYRWGENNYLEGVVGAFVDYWPTYTSKGDGNHDMIVVNQSYIDRRLSIKPYEIWIKKSSSTSGEQIYKGLKDNNIEISQLADANQMIVKMKNDPMLQGTNGSLSLGFIATMSITMLGFLIYWIMSIKKRTLQFGILRAMGLGFKNINSILASEQILVSGAAIAMGVIIGEINAKISMPLLNVMASQSKQILPQTVISYSGDYLKLGVIFAIITVGGFLILKSYVSRIKIDQAIKLGED